MPHPSLFIIGDGGIVIGETDFSFARDSLVVVCGRLGGLDGVLNVSSAMLLTNSVSGPTKSFAPNFSNEISLGNEATSTVAWAQLHSEAKTLSPHISAVRRSSLQCRQQKQEMKELA